MEKIKFVQDWQRQMNLHLYQKFSDIVILCIGSNKIIGDCIGPMVGQKLKSTLKKEKNIIIYGNMEETLNFKNAKQVIENILETYEKPFVITIDSALGTKEMIKRIVINTGWIKIGNSLGRSICYYSHMNIKGIVGQNKNKVEENIKTLKEVNPILVMELSEKIANTLNEMIPKIDV